MIPKVKPGDGRVWDLIGAPVYELAVNAPVELLPAQHAMEHTK